MDDLNMMAAIQALEEGLKLARQSLANPDSSLNKHAIAIAITYAETAQLWLANSRE